MRISKGDIRKIMIDKELIIRLETSGLNPHHTINKIMSLKYRNKKFEQAKSKEERREWKEKFDKIEKECRIALARGYW
jgi:hypothetical protein